MTQKTETRSAQKSADGLPSSQNLNRLIRRLQQLPEQEPPCDLSDRVLAKLAPKESSLWQRFRRWLQMPRMVAIRPLHLAPAGAAFVLILAAGLAWLGGPAVWDRPIETPPLIAVALTLEDGQARSVSLIGSFNGWRPAGYALQRHAAQNRWSIEFKVPPGTYEYAFLIDGWQIRPDPRALFYKLDGFGSHNSLLIADVDDAHSL